MVVNTSRIHQTSWLECSATSLPSILPLNWDYRTFLSTSTRSLLPISPMLYSSPRSHWTYSPSSKINALALTTSNLLMKMMLLVYTSTWCHWYPIMRRTDTWLVQLISLTLNSFTWCKSCLSTLHCLSEWYSTSFLLYRLNLLWHKLSN